MHTRKAIFIMRVVKCSNRDPERLWSVYRGYSELDLKSPKPPPSKLAVVLSAAVRGLEAAGDPLQPKSSMILLLLKCI